MVVVIEHWHASGAMRVRVTTQMHVDRTTMMMVGRMVVWMRVSQGSAYGGALDGQRQHESDGLSGHGHIVGEVAHLVKTYPERSIARRRARRALSAEQGGRNSPVT